MSKFMTAAFAALLLSSCLGTMPTPREKAIIVADLQDGLTAARELVGPQGHDYIDALRLVLDAFAQGEELDWANAIASVRVLEPFLRQKLLDAGWDAGRVETALAVSRIALRHLEDFLLMNGGQGGPAVPAPTLGGES